MNTFTFFPKLTKTEKIVFSSLAGLAVIFSFILYIFPVKTYFAPTHYQDVTADATNALLLRAERKTLEDMWLLGIDTDEVHPRVMDEYRVYPKPGIGGRHVVYRTTLAQGTVLKVTKVERCTNCYSAIVRYTIRITNPPFNSGQYPVYVYDYAGAFENALQNKTVEN